MIDSRAAPTERLFGKETDYARLFNDVRETGRLARLVEYVLRHDRTVLVSDSNVVCLAQVRQYRGIADDNDSVFQLASVIGRKNAVLLSLLGFKTLTQIAEAHPVALASIPNIGSMRFKKIKDFLESRGFTYGDPEPASSGFQAFADSFQYELPFAEF